MMKATAVPPHIRGAGKTYKESRPARARQAKIGRDRSEAMVARARRAAWDAPRPPRTREWLVIRCWSQGQRAEAIIATVPLAKVPPAFARQLRDGGGVNPLLRAALDRFERAHEIGVGDPDVQSEVLALRVDEVRTHPDAEMLQRELWVRDWAKPQLANELRTMLRGARMKRRRRVA